VSSDRRRQREQERASVISQLREKRQSSEADLNSNRANPFSLVDPFQVRPSSKTLKRHGKSQKKVLDPLKSPKSPKSSKSRGEDDERRRKRLSSRKKSSRRKRRASPRQPSAHEQAGSGVEGGGRGGGVPRSRRQSAAITAEWTCSECTLINSILSSKCSACSAEPPDWTCPQCTLVNSVLLVNCAACLGAAPEAGASAAGSTRAKTTQGSASPKTPRIPQLQHADLTADLNRIAEQRRASLDFNRPPPASHARRNSLLQQQMEAQARPPPPPRRASVPKNIAAVAEAQSTKANSQRAKPSESSNESD